MQSVVPSFYLGVCLLVTFLIINPWQSYVCFIRSGVTRCTLLMLLYLDLMCQCRLHVMLWSHIGTLMHCLAAEPCSTARLFIPFSVSLWKDRANNVFDGVGLVGFKSRANASLFGLSCSIPTIVVYSFSLSLLSVYRLVLWGWGLWSDRVYITLSACTADFF